MTAECSWSGDIDALLEHGVNTGLKITSGDRITIIASGWIKYGREEHAWASPCGNIGKDWKTKEVAILKARVGDTGRSYDVGSGVYQMVTQESGELRLFVNDSSYSDNSGKFHAKVYITQREGKCASAQDQWKGYVPANSSDWVQTGVSVLKGDSLLLVAAGKAQYDSQGRTFGPDGDSQHPSAKSPDPSFVFSGAIAGALLIKVGDTVHGIGSGGAPWIVPADGQVSFIFNDTDKASEYKNNTGGYDVSFVVLR